MEHLALALHTSAGIISVSYFIEDSQKWIYKHNSSAPVLVKIIHYLQSKANQKLILLLS